MPRCASGFGGRSFEVIANKPYRGEEGTRSNEAMPPETQCFTLNISYVKVWGLQLSSPLHGRLEVCLSLEVVLHALTKRLLDEMPFMILTS